MHITSDLLLECARAGKQAIAESIQRFENAGTGVLAMTRAIIATYERARPRGQLERTNHALAMEVADLRAKLEQFADAAAMPRGVKWHNPQNVTPETVEWKSGYRLMTANEETIPEDAQIFGVNGWNDSSRRGWVRHDQSTYRTRQPLPDRERRAV